MLLRDKELEQNSTKQQRPAWILKLQISRLTYLHKSQRMEFLILFSIRVRWSGIVFVFAYSLYHSTFYLSFKALIDAADLKDAQFDV